LKYEEGGEKMRKTLLVLAVLAMAAVIATPAAATTYFEPFDYENDDIIVCDGWTGPDGIPITVEGRTAKLLYTSLDWATKGVQVTLPTPIGGDMIYWCVRVWVGGGTAGNVFDIQANDAAGLNFARWYGGYNSERPRINGYSGTQVGTGVTLVPNMWNQLCVYINTVTQQSTFYHNGTLVNTLPYLPNQPNIGNSVAKIYMGFQNASSDKVGSWKFYDDIWVSNTACYVPEPSSLLAMSAFGLGMLGYIKRRRA